MSNNLDSTAAPVNNHLIRPRQVSPLPIGPGGNNSVKQQMNQINTQLTMLNAPLELKISKDISPYASSPYDICKYEPAHLIFSKEQEVPYCLSNIF